MAVSAGPGLTEQLIFVCGDVTTALLDTDDSTRDAGLCESLPASHEHIHTSVLAEDLFEVFISL